MIYMGVYVYMKGIEVIYMYVQYVLCYGCAMGAMC